MKKLILISLALIALSLSVSAQKIEKPTLTPSEPTAAQKELIDQGVQLHDEKRYADAILKYRQVLKENPDCVLAQYELAYSLYAKGDLVTAKETAFKLTKYISKLGVRAYGMIANVLDDEGKPNEAIEIYKDAIKQLKGDKSFKTGVSSLYYNLAITYYRQKMTAESKSAVKEAIETDFNYANPNYLLAEILYQGKYKVPALLAASRMLSLEINSERSRRASLIFQEVLKAGVSKGDNGNINILVDMSEPKDEGDFTSLSLIMGMLGAGTEGEAESKNKSFEDKFVDKVDGFIGFLASDAKKAKSSFVGKNYVPYLLALKEKGYTKVFSYLVLQQSGNAEAEKWILSNSQKAVDFLDWAKSYELPKK
jgi:hypothetical protein